jgi:tRNA G18 (ribose-2'-O)-methylase SpoU
MHQSGLSDAIFHRPVSGSFDHCPICRSPMSKIGEPYANYQPMDQALDEVSRSLILVLDNLRSTHNVGSIFRTADGAGVKHIYCGGTTPTPEHPKIKKTSLGAESLKSWSYCPNTVQLVSDLKIAGSLILALETTPNRFPFSICHLLDEIKIVLWSLF